MSGARDRPLVVVTEPSHPLVRELLAPRCALVHVDSEDALDDALREADGLHTLLTYRIDEQRLALAPRLRAIGSYAVGTDHLDLDACRARGVRVANTPDVLTNATAELTVALLFAAARRLPEGAALCATGDFGGFAPTRLLGRSLCGMHAVLVGRGRIGSRVGTLLVALGLSVTFVTRDDDDDAVAAKLACADVLSLHLPGTSDNAGWLSRKRLEALPASAIVLNTARGPLIDEDALIDALLDGRLFAAGLDVFADEPRISPRLRSAPRVVLTPHVGSATREAREGMARRSAEGLLALLDGRDPPNRVV